MDALQLALSCGARVGRAPAAGAAAAGARPVFGDAGLPGFCARGCMVSHVTGRPSLTHTRWRSLLRT